jgi:1-aminocyclopropane-1-carboxylate deaminase/D-cysteine desulfhydrase-like pyridoxal-dependent ACC family enzyme
MLNEKTPIECYNVEGKQIYVKREDLFGTYPAPLLAKLRGARIVLQRLKAEGITKIAVFDTRISKAGQGIAYLCKEMDLKCLAGFPKLKDKDIAESHKIAKEVLGAELMSLVAGRTAICYARLKKEAQSLGYYVLPLGLTFSETSHAVELISRAETKPFNSIVLSAGTGVISSGVAAGTDCTVYAVSCGMNNKRQWKRIQTLRPDKLFCNLILVQPEYDYYDALDTTQCPFPTSPYYDMKAWTWLLKNYDRLAKPVLFWNIGV